MVTISYFTNWCSLHPEEKCHECYRRETIGYRVYLPLFSIQIPWRDEIVVLYRRNHCTGANFYALLQSYDKHDYVHGSFKIM